MLDGEAHLANTTELSMCGGDAAFCQIIIIIIRPHRPYYIDAVYCYRPIEMPFGLWARMGPKNHVLNGSSDRHGKGQFLGKASPTVKYRDFLPCAVQKRLNRSICRLGSGLRWAEGSTSSIIFARWRQCAQMGGQIGANWRI